jgi:hypothetical protein
VLQAEHAATRCRKFKKIVSRGTTLTTKDVDFTAKVRPHTLPSTLLELSAAAMTRRLIPNDEAIVPGLMLTLSNAALLMTRWPTSQDMSTCWVSWC